MNKIICTGQALCYDDNEQIECPASGDFYGQDGNHSGTDYCFIRQLTADTDVVTDLQTGLMWEKYEAVEGSVCDQGCSFEDAVDYCKDLVIDSYSDWRLPSINELETIIDFSRTDPSVFPVFDSFSSLWFWSSTQSASDSEEAWYIHFKAGYAATTSKSYFPRVKCVRGETLHESTSFSTENKDGQKVVTDTDRKLQWAYKLSTQKWQGALKYCEELVYAGCSDWRLPNINELKTLFNRGLKQPASTFPEMPDGTWFWSSTTYVGDTEKAWYVFSGKGTSQYTEKANNRRVICVR